MIRISNIKVKNGANASLYTNGVMEPEALSKSLIPIAAKALKIDAKAIADLSVFRHSIDARKKPDIFDIYTIDITLNTNEKKILQKARNKNAQLFEPVVYELPEFGTKEMTKPPVVVGAGPCGLFAAYELACLGFKPILIERGRAVEDRQKDVENFWKTGVLDPMSNVQFGEGGAGAFSDGKLNTMVRDKDGIGRRALKIFIDHGAPKEIYYEAKPHIGTDKLVDVVKNIRQDIIKLGGQVLFETKMSGLIMSDNKVTGIKVQDIAGNESVIETDTVVMAIGHSARDTFEVLNNEGVFMEPKAFAVGLRVEHPQRNINRSQYGVYESPTLPASPYKVVHNTSKGRGVYSFCMCPGGHVVNASSEEGHLCVNGMSYYARDSRNANSAIIVTVKPEDFGGEGPLCGVKFQRELEKKAFELGQGKVPVEYLADYRNKGIVKGNTDERKDWNTPCIKGDYVFAKVHDILPDDLKEAIDEGMTAFGRMIEGFDADDTLMEGVESRTSSPVRITRGEDLQAVNTKGLYPCGEGAGYAGGIMSAAMDGMKVAARICQERCPKK